MNKGIGFLRGTGVKMDRDVVTHRRQLFSLMHDGLGVLMTQQDEGDFCHFGNSLPLWDGLCSIMFLMCKREDVLNKHEFFVLLVKRSADVIGNAPK
jgi:hypothetical protein